MVLGRATFANCPNPVGLAHPAVGHARKPGDPFRTWTLRPLTRLKEQKLKAWDLWPPCLRLGVALTEEEGGWPRVELIAIGADGARSSRISATTSRRCPSRGRRPS